MAKKNEGTEVVEKVVMRPLADLVRNPKNPRKSDPQGLKDLCESIKNLPGYFRARPIILSDRTGVLMIIDGERRSEAAAILEMKLVPTILMHGLTEEQEDEIMVRGNTHNGVWDSVKLSELSQHWQGKIPIWGAPKEWYKVEEEKYTRKIISPVYEPKGEKPDVSELFDTRKYDELVGDINKAKIKDAEIREFLLLAATRHVVFNYEKIAEFYAHAPAKIQRLFEASALVIIDFDDAIGGGYVKLCESLIEQYKAEQND